MNRPFSQSAGTDFFQHLVGVQEMMRDLTEDQDLVQAGLFHSIYGTEGFQAFTVPLEKRSEIRQIVGDRAEYICYGDLPLPFSPCSWAFSRVVVGRG